jgi:hypothetical protein
LCSVMELARPVLRLDCVYRQIGPALASLCCGSIVVWGLMNFNASDPMTGKTSGTVSNVVATTVSKKTTYKLDVSHVVPGSNTRTMSRIVTSVKYTSGQTVPLLYPPRDPRIVVLAVDYTSPATQNRIITGVASSLLLCCLVLFFYVRSTGGCVWGQ